MAAFLRFTKYGQSLWRFTRRGFVPAKHRRPSLISQCSETPGVEPFTSFPPALHTQRSESSITKAPLATPVHMSLTPLPELNWATSSAAAPSVEATASTVSFDQRTGMTVSRREKEDSLALLMPHLDSQGSSSRPFLPSSHSLSGFPLRDTDSGPVTNDSLSPILPPEYDPRWART